MKHLLRSQAFRLILEGFASPPCSSLGCALQLIWLLVKTNGTIWGRCTTHFRTYFSGDWDVHWGYDLDFDPWPYGGKSQRVSQSEPEGRSLSFTGTGEPTLAFAPGKAPVFDTGYKASGQI